MSDHCGSPATRMPLGSNDFFKAFKLVSMYICNSLLGDKGEEPGGKRVKIALHFMKFSLGS